MAINSQLVLNALQFLGVKIQQRNSETSAGLDFVTGAQYDDLYFIASNSPMSIKGKRSFAHFRRATSTPELIALQADSSDRSDIIDFRDFVIYHWSSAISTWIPSSLPLNMFFADKTMNELWHNDSNSVFRKIVAKVI